MTKIWNLTPISWGFIWCLLVGLHPAWFVVRPASSMARWPFIGTLDSPNLTFLRSVREPDNHSACSCVPGSKALTPPALTWPALPLSQARLVLTGGLSCRSLSSVSLLGPGRQSWGRRWQGMILRGPPQIPLWLLSGLPWDNWPQMAVFPHALGCWVTRLCGAGCMPHHKRPRFP